MNLSSELDYILSFTIAGSAGAFLKDLGLICEVPKIYKYLTTRTLIVATPLLHCYPIHHRFVFHIILYSSQCRPDLYMNEIPNRFLASLQFSPMSLARAPIAPLNPDVQFNHLPPAEAHRFEISRNIILLVLGVNRFHLISKL